MRQTLDLQTIFSDTTEELRKSIYCDRVLVYQIISQQQENTTLTRIAINQSNWVKNIFNLLEDNESINQ
jgi:hypothetical protein